MSDPRAPISRHQYVTHGVFFHALLAVCSSTSNFILGPRLSRCLYTLVNKLMNPRGVASHDHNRLREYCPEQNLTTEIFSKNLLWALWFSKPNHPSRKPVLWLQLNRFRQDVRCLIWGHAPRVCWWSKTGRAKSSLAKLVVFIWVCVSVVYMNCSSTPWNTLWDALWVRFVARCIRVSCFVC